MTVNIQDVIDETPVISGTLSVNIDEEQAIGTPVAGLFSVADADAGDVLTYALSGKTLQHVKLFFATYIVTGRIVQCLPVW